MTSMEREPRPEVNSETIAAGIQQQLIAELHDNTPVAELSFTEQFAVLPEHTAEQRARKARTAINAMRTTLLTTFDGNYDLVNTPEKIARFELINDLAESNLDRLGNDPEAANISFVTDGYKKWAEAAQLAQEKSHSFSAATEVTEEYLVAWQRYMRGEITPPAFAEGSVSNAIAAAFGGPHFAREAGLMAKAAFEANEKVFAETGEYVLSAGDDYILGGLLRNADLLTGDPLKDGSHLQIEALQRLKTMKPWQMHQYLMVSHSLESASARFR